jgi:uncharacterized membrane protein YhaH (DUF805 family)
MRGLAIVTARFNVVLTGDVLPECTREAVVQALAFVMKVPAERAARLVAGRETVVRRDVPEARVASYLAALHRAGAAARADAVAPLAPPEPLAAAEIPFPKRDDVAHGLACSGPATQWPAMYGQTVEEPATISPPARADTARETQPSVPQPERRPATGVRDASQPGLGLKADEVMACPACGAQQARRTLCRACGVDMPRVRAAKIEAAHAPRVAAAPDASAIRHGVSPRAAAGRADGPHETPHPLGWSLHGRIGRLRYLAYAFSAYVPLVAGLALGALIGGGGHAGAGFVIPLGLGALVTVWLAIRAMVLRMHDLNRSGKWVLAMMVAPAVAAFSQSPGAVVATAVILIVATLLLILVPGSRGANAYGVPPGPNTAWTIVGAVLALMLGAIAGVADPGDTWSDAQPDDPERAVDMRRQS